VAGLGKRTFQQFDILTADDVNGYLMDQSVMCFASDAARNTAIPSPTEGMMSYLNDINQYQMNLDSSASGWYPAAGQMPLAYGSQSGNISTTINTFVTMTYNSLTLRGGITHSAGVFTVPHAGVYTISATANWASAGAGNRNVSIQTSEDDGATWDERATSRMYLGITSTFYQTNHFTYYLPAETQIRVQVQQSTGTVNASGTAFPMNACIYYLGA